MELELAGKVAIVTGASRGIGRAIARALCAEGARVCGCARGEEALRAEVASWPAGERPHLAVAGDISSPEVVARIVAEAGDVDILVNNVGGSGARHFDDADEADFVTTFERNFFSGLRLCKAAIPGMRARGGGAIVFIASVWGKEAGGAPAYNAAKAAEISLAKAMARDLAKDGIRVNSVAPGSILFPGGGWERRQKADPEGIAAYVAREMPFGRFGRPEEVASVVTFLCSPRASWVHGTCVVVDGGQGRSF